MELLNKRLLITGGTVFVSRYAAEYFVKRGCEVFVLNRNHHKQSDGVILLEGDRHHLGDLLQNKHFDAVLDITAYHAQDIEDLLAGGFTYDTYILISSSAVYPQGNKQPISEDTPLGENCYWGTYGTDKIAAEQALLAHDPNAYILRPPYLYGPMNNVYREAFVFECAEKKRPFYLPQQGDMKLQFFHVHDLCRLMENILISKPTAHILNAGNDTSITIRNWVSLCYHICGETPTFISVPKHVEQRKYFSFYDYEYYLDVSKMQELLPKTLPMEEGLREAYLWYQNHQKEVIRKPLIDYIDVNLKQCG